MRAMGTLLVAGLLPALASPPAAADPATLLLQAGQATRVLSYQGVVVYRDAQKMEVLRVVHRQEDGLEQERLTSLTGLSRDIVREGERVTCIAEEGVEAEASLPSGLFPAMSATTLAAAGQHYRFEESGNARVAGRECRKVGMVPRDEFRYGYQLCIDRVTSLPLRVTLTEAGKTVEQMLFTEIAFPREISDAAFALPPGVRVTTAATTPAATLVAVGTPPLWQLASLPPGFRVILRGQQAEPGGTGVVEHLVLSDGVSAVSVFGSQRPTTTKAFSGFSSMGAMNAYGRTVGVFQVTIVGEVPRSTVRMIGDGLAPAPEVAGTPSR